MAVLLESERKSFKGRLFLSCVYAILSLGGLTMLLPFMVMLSSSFSGPYDYHRHSPILRSLFSTEDRFMRSLSTYFPRFPRDVYPDAPPSWGSWIQVAKDKPGIHAFFQREFSTPHPSPPTALRDRILSQDIVFTTCSYDPRHVASFLSSYTSLDEINRSWPVRYKSLFDVSFLAESRAPLSHKNYSPPLSNPKFRAFLAFKDHYRHQMLLDNDYICRTLPFPLVRSEADRSAIRSAITHQFIEHGWRDFFSSAFANYKLTSQYLFVRGRAFANTIILVILSVLAALTVNPLAAYALSRFHLPSKERILLFLLSTMAFPAAVTAIPGFLLVRDLGLLNTFAALILPSAASGMSIFILKGFFDALPRELYEAASIDGASEWTIFSKITLPMTTPILAVNALTHFISAYNSWEWAFLVCQKESHWTLAVWLYQMSQSFAGQPWCVTAAFVLVSIPTALVFILCQKTILRGIVLPSMK